MRVWAVFKKELRLYFTSPVAYVVVTIFLVISGLFFSSIFRFFSAISMQAAMNPAFARDLNLTEGVMRPLFSNIRVIMLLVMPVLTMRLFAEEKKTGTMELLLTYPVRDGEVLLGKYAAVVTLFLAMLSLTAVYPVMLTYFAQLESGPLLTGYLGLVLMGATFLAIGVLASSLTENQIVAAVITFGILLVFWVIGWSADFAGPSLGKLLSHLSILEHFDGFGKGVIDTKDVIYYLNFTILCLFLTLRSLESKRWRG
ncbi:MAG: ABC transporter permease subunit [Candidatus Methylomirabilia bacterium]